MTVIGILPLGKEENNGLILDETPEVIKQACLDPLDIQYSSLERDYPRVCI